MSSTEFSLAADTPGIELLESLIRGFCRRIDEGERSADSWILRKLKLIVQSGCGTPVSVTDCARRLHCSSGYLLSWAAFIDAYARARSANNAGGEQCPTK